MPNKTKELKSERLTKKGQILRVPRPNGITYALSQHHKEPDPNQKQEILNKIKQRILTLWTMTGMIINNKVYTIDQLAQYLNLSNKDIMLRMNKEMERIGNIYQDDEGKRLARVTFFTSLLKSVEIRALSEAQTRLLLASQGADYKPYISGEVNKSIANLINAQKPILDMIKLTMEKSTDNPILPNATTNNTQNIYIGPDEAVRLINAKSQSILQDPEYLELKMGQFGALPDVNARNQDLTGIGIRHNGTLPTEEEHKKLEREERKVLQNRVPDELLDGEDFIA